MDMDSMLNIERRTCVKNSDIDDFLSKADAVEAAIRGMRDGTVDPNNIKIEGIDSPEEIAEKERKKQQRLAEIKAKNEALALERKKEECKRWWDGVDIMVPNDQAALPSAPEMSEEEADAASFHQMRYNSNYSRWDQWVPSDPATKVEEEDRLQSEEQKRNEEFEKNNKEFCDKYMNDMNEREKEKSKKVQGSDSNRLRGNNYFKHKKYSDALKCYMDALKDQPYDPKILINIAQVHIKSDETEDALEFLSRVLRVDPLHTKGLSRKAFVLSTLNRNLEALGLARTALGTEPDNVDLQRQVMELELAVKTKEDEEVISALKAKVCGRTVEKETAEIEKNLRMEKNPSTVVQRLEEAFELPLLATGFELLDRYAGSSGGDTVVNSQCANLLKVDKNMRVYFRTNGGLKLCISTLREKSISFLSIEAADKGSTSEVMSECLDLLQASTVDDGANMAAAVVQIPDIVELLTGALSTKLSLSLSVMNFMNSVFSERMSISPAVLFSYKHALVKVSDFLYLVATTLTPNCNDVGLHLSCLKGCYAFVKSYLFHDSIKSGKFSFPLTKSCGSALVENLALTVQLLIKRPGVDDSALELALEALMGCSQYNLLRGCFGDSIRAINMELGVPCPTPLHVLALLSTEEYRKSFLHLCFGILMNICVSDDEQAQSAGPTMKDKIILSGCLLLVVDIVTKSTENRKKLDPLVLARGAGLLARLAASPLALETLKSPFLYERVVQLLSENLQLPNRCEKWITDECSHFVRIIASVPNLSEECLKIAYNRNLVESILQVFPNPRVEMGDITPASVVMPPSFPVTAILVGNAARCLMPLADDPKNADIIFRKSSAKGIEKLICAMANCSDMRVRKNIAILLAKGARIPEVRAKIEQFRGMQMLVELQKQL